MTKCDYCIYSTPDKKCRAKVDNSLRATACGIAIDTMKRVIDKTNLLEAVEPQEINERK